MRFGINDPAMADFVALIDDINRLAEQSEGFIWRPLPIDVSAEKLRAFENYFVPFHLERFFYNMSVWNDVENLKHYVYQTAHANLFRQKDRWMDHFDRANLALWWVPAGYRPTVADAAERLLALDEKGATPFAFTFKTFFPQAQP